MHYETNYLSAVILRLDFAPLRALQENTNIEIKPDFSARISEIYPVVVGQPTANLSVNIGPLGAGVNQHITGIQWQHRKEENGAAAVVLAPEFLAIEYGKDCFDHFPSFRAEIEASLNAFLLSYQPAIFSRIGLRYINEISIPEGGPLEWDGIIAPDLVTAVLGCMQDGMEMMRSMHQVNVRRNESTMIFNYGLHNPDFPNPVARRAFILDYDCSRADVAVNQAMQIVDELNAFCESMFERSIEEGLRQKMGVIAE